MKAIVQRAYGPPEVLEMVEIQKPVAGDNEVLVKIHATSVTSGDARLRAFNIPGVFWLPARLIMGIGKPKKNILGAEFAGEIEAVGKDASRFKPGDQVFGLHVYNCYAQYKTLPETAAIAVKPNNLTYEQAAAIPFGALTALFFLRKGNIARGQKILINGASGSVGTAAVQLARHFGAEVTAVCSAGNAELVKSLGAHHVIDYTHEDFTKNGTTYDIIYDTVGTISFARAKNSLAPNGFYLAGVMGLTEILQSIWTSFADSQKVIGGVSTEKSEDLDTLRQLVEAGDLVPVIDRQYPLEQIVEAHRYVDTGHKKGNVVIKVAVG